MFYLTGYESEFEKDKDYLNTNNLPYDYKSLMHYDSFSYSKNKLPTLITRKGDIIPIPQVATELDYLHINLAYCGGKGK